MIPFKPSQRSFHTATFINDKLYIIGGNLSTNFLNDFFYLDVSAAFNTENLPWVDLSSTNNIVPPHADATSVKGGVNNDRLILYGGITTDPKTPSLYEFDYLYSFDTLSNLWSPKIAANFPKKELLTGIIDHSGKMYLWGGYDEVKTLNDMFILDTIKLIGRVGSLVNAPTPRYNYGAALLPNNNIIYFGKQVILVNLILLIVFPPFYSNIDYLGLDGQSIIIFGGTATFSLQGLEPEDSLYELNLSSFEWIIPKISNTSQIPKSRMYHKANVIGKYMVISFGEHFFYIINWIKLLSNF
ncbi:hypothetical protein C1645_790835 [Glomus cerebriforme]|uniref:Galactose oxidase n=1 Tax=Glomus cerebriforme TaxID=658196 RepID=A0A397SEQ8_9GLOM|nr:hypothetical protein C1645_790835 [Glomus cerebriforme]